MGADGAASAPHPLPSPPAVLPAGLRSRCASLPTSHHHKLTVALRRVGLDLRTSRKGKPSPLHIDLIGWISERARPRALTKSSVASCSVTLTICFSSISPDQYDLCYAFADFILALSLILLGQPFPVSTATARLRPPLSILVTNQISSSFFCNSRRSRKRPCYSVRTSIGDDEPEEV